jgi:poly(3-hydroxybutyrate) depolymerase
MFSSYQWHDGFSQAVHRMSGPGGVWASAWAHTNPALGHVPGLWEIARRWTRPSRPPRWSLNQDHSTRIITRPPVFLHPFCTLQHFTTDESSTLNRPALLVVAPLSGHYATLLRDTVATLVKDHEVYITEWVNARDVPLKDGTLDHEGYIDTLWDALRHMGLRAHVLAVCQPAVQVLELAALMARHKDPVRPLSITLMGGPVDTREGPTLVNRFALGHSLEWFRQTMIHTVPESYQGAGRQVYPGFLQLAGFVMLNPERHAEAHRTFLADLAAGRDEKVRHHRHFYDEYVSVMDMPAEYFLETVRDVFQEHTLAQGNACWRGERIDPGALHDTALLTVEGEHDDITGPGQTRAAHALCSSLPARLKKHVTARGVGHYGLFSGHHWREEIAPEITRWIRLHPDPHRQKPVRLPLTDGRSSQPFSGGTL